ncbi:MAG: hypothetical protein ACYTDU_01510 [Planctomycetota bacterium]|jgi:hypothetical protein
MPAPNRRRPPQRPSRRSSLPRAGGRALRRVFERYGFAESSFRYVDDCRTFANSRFLQWLEFGTWRLLRTVGLHDPEVCLLAVYTRQ